MSTHRHSTRTGYTSTYSAWKALKLRCLCKTSKSYPRYGGRGITVCKRWMKFENFLKDMGERPTGLTLERINNKKGYYKSNCRWATALDQANNKRNNIFVKYKGRSLTIAQWARELNIRVRTLYNRRYRGKTGKELLAPSVNKRLTR